MPFNENQPAYQRLRKLYAERRKDVAFWVGAGLSQPAGLPTWPQLRQILASQAFETLVTLKEDEARLREAELNRIYGTDNLWDAFGIIKGVLGDTMFKAGLREIFEAADNIEPPELYKEIWSLDGVSSLITLNVDGFANRAHRRVRPAEDIAVFSGREAADYVHLVNRRKPFIANLHGIHQSSKSWVFTRSDLKSLLKDNGYVSFAQFIFNDLAIVFMGISADDVAAGGFLEQLTVSGIDLGQHFWITDRRDAATDRWANKAGVQVIRYEPEIDKDGKQDHTTVLKQILRDIGNYVSTETAAPAIVAPVEEIDKLPSIKELRFLDDDDELRSTLSGYAKSVISKHDGDTQNDDYRKFLKEYSPVIHQAWHLTSWEPHNKFYRYTVVEKISSGSFSSVWKLVDASGNFLAAKIIQMDNLEKGPQLDSFRRGVQSLSYLTNADVPGTAKLVAAYEIPTSLIMEHVEGDNLSHVVNSGQYKFWVDGVKIILNVCKHIEYSHNLPQGVMHRDVRPSNIMVPYFFWPEDAASSASLDRHDVVILNYDMSWHKTAQGKTISGNIEEAGYYAPEQLVNIDDDLARSTLVDSYGIGMSLFFSYTGSMPPTGGGKSIDWPDILKAKIRRDPSLKWRSAPERVKRLILTASSTNPKDRPTVRSIRAELAQLIDAVEGRWEEISPDFWAEEIFCHVIQSDYEASSSGGVFSKQLRTGRTISMQGDLRARSVNVSFRNLGTEATNRSGVDKLWGEKLRSSKEILSSNGWSIRESTRYSNMEIVLEASLPVEQLKEKFDKAVKCLARALDQVRLD